MTIKELMSSNICFVKGDAPVSEAVSLMKKYDIGFIPVCDNKGCLIGLLTDRDILLRGLHNPQFSLEQITASEIMTTQVTSISTDMNIHDAALIFSQKKVHRLPVLENSRLVGVLSLSDLAKKRILLAEVGDIMASMAKDAHSLNTLL
ncbi:MAG: CBS domain-containing protein [Emergencia sp.]|nr:CBS domain-containing protein [Emergencia sp.]